MFLTRFQINPRRRHASKLLTSPQAMHAAVLAGFPDETATDAGRLLWRIDQSSTKHLLIVVSPTKPDFTHLVEQAGWPTLNPGWETRDYTPLLNRLANEQQWAFRLTANPTRSLSPEPGEKRGRVVAHRTVTHQLEWLKRQADRHGFVLVEHETERIEAETGEPIFLPIPTTRVNKSEVVRFTRDGHTVTIRTATFDGLLKVTDEGAFRSALSKGIGPARAYGCGLLTVAPFTSLTPGKDASSIKSIPEAETK